MFGVSSDVFSFLLITVLGLTVFIMFSDFQAIYRRMEVSGICLHICYDSHVQWDHICIVISNSVVTIISLITERLFLFTRSASDISGSYIH